MRPTIFLVKIFIATILLLPFNSYAEVGIDDPLQKSNQAVFKFNDVFDRYTLKPIAKGWQFITPQIVDDGVSNMFGTIGEMPNAANAILQGKPKSAGKAGLRLFINLTLGFFGVFDVATELGIEEQKEDFGQTLARWGVPSGPYIVLPFLGPSTVRDGFGLIPDLYMSPLNVDHTETKIAVWATRFVDGRADLLATESIISGDRYFFIRDAYLQNREYLILDGEVEDNFGEDELEDDWLEDF